MGPFVDEGAVVGVYPEGLERSWNLGREESEADDVAFTGAILSMLEEAEGVDPARSVATGFSNGAAMIHELAMESDAFVGIAPVVSHLLATKTPSADGASVSVLQLSGTEDDLVPYEGGTGVLGHEFLPAEASSAAWAAHNGCAETPTERASGVHTILEWEGCRDDRRVVHVRMNGVGHDMARDIEGDSLRFLTDFLLESWE